MTQSAVKQAVEALRPEKVAELRKLVGDWNRCGFMDPEFKAADHSLKQQGVATACSLLTMVAALTAEQSRVPPPPILDIDGILTEICELPNRTSPEDQPDMMLVTGDELRTILLAYAVEATALPAVGDWRPTHRHYKGGFYREIARGRIEADLSPVVIYDNEKGETWVRPAEDFDAWVTPPGRDLPLCHRFKALPAPQPALYKHERAILARKIGEAIQSLATERDALRKALEPTADAARAVDASMADDYEITYIFTAGVLRAARSLLSEGGGE